MSLDITCCQGHTVYPDRAEKIKSSPVSMPNMTGRLGYRTMEMNGGSSAPYLACTPCVPLFVLCSISVETEGLLDFQGWAGIISIVRWNLRPVIFGVDDCRCVRPHLKSETALGLGRDASKNSRLTFFLALLAHLSFVSPSARLSHTHQNLGGQFIRILVRHPTPTSDEFPSDSGWEK